MCGMWDIMFLILFIESILAWNFLVYILAALCEGVSCSIWNKKTLKPETCKWAGFIKGSIFAPLAFTGFLFYFSTNSAINKRRKEELRELENKYVSEAHQLFQSL